MTAYAEFRLRIERGATEGSYRIEATGLGGEQDGPLTLPFNDAELENFVLKVGRTRRGVRRIESPEMELAKRFGGQLFTSVMDGKVGELYRAAFTEARANGQGLRVTLALTDVPELGGIPWEYLYDPPDFLSISTWTPVVRYLDLPKPRRALEVTLPLRILGVISAPSDAEPLDTAAERARLDAALKPLMDAGAVTIDWLEEANLLALARKLRPDTYHILHYIGHGGFDDASGEGALLFEDDTGRGRAVSGDQLGTILHDKLSLRLVVLNSCEGARNSVSDPFSGVATGLVQRQIPAVIGMQFEITDRAAVLFAGEFYSMLAEGQPVDSAITEARLAIFADHNDVEWGTPVLFMRVADGRLFDIPAATTVPRLDPVDAPPPVAVAAATAGDDPPPTPGPVLTAPSIPAALVAEAVIAAGPAGGTEADDVDGPGAATVAVAAAAAGTAAGSGVGGDAPAADTAPLPEDTAPDADSDVSAEAAVIAGTAVVAGAGGSAPPGTPPPVVIVSSVPEGPADAIAVGAVDPAGAGPATTTTAAAAGGIAGRVPWPIVGVAAAAVVLLLIALRFLLPADAPTTSGTITVNSAATPETGAVSVTGRDFGAGESIDIELDDIRVMTVAAAADGTFLAAVPIDGRRDGTISVTGRTSGRQASGDFAVPVVIGSPSDQPASPSSGASASSSDPPPTDTPEPTTTPTATTTTAARCDPPHAPGILFYSDRSDRQSESGQRDNELYVMDPTPGATPQQLTTNRINDMFPTWSPDRRRVAYTMASGRGDRDIAICQPDGTIDILKPDGYDEADDWFPTWSVDDWIAFVRTDGKNASIWKMRSDGSGAEEVLSWSRIDERGAILRAPAWSPDGRTLALFGGRTAKDFDLIFVLPDGSIDQYGERGVSELNPSWSPDGTTLALVRDVGGLGCDNNDLATLDFASRSLIAPRLFESDVQDGNPVWSPDGDRIAFYQATTAGCKEGGVGYRLWLIDPAGTDPTQLMPDRRGRNLDPKW